MKETGASRNYKYRKAENNEKLISLSFSIRCLGSVMSDPSQPNYQYFPNMYEPVGYETYADSDAFANGIEAQIPVEGSIARGWQPYDILIQMKDMKR